MHRTPFPIQVGLSILNATDAFTDIKKMLVSEDRQHDDPFQGFDRHYVPLEYSEREIYFTLDSVYINDPQVVLLHGGAGKGKSTVAMSTVLHYSRKTQFDHVVFLNCGHQVTTLDIQFELIQRLGPQLLSDLQGKKNRGPVSIARQVKKLLAERTVRLILDDVSEGEFLREIVNLCGRRVECLVTSQLASMRGSLDPSKFVSIEIQDVDQDTASKILGTHLGLHYIIPPHLEEVANKMIRATEFNPLALATLRFKRGAVMRKKKLQSQKLKQWETASTIFFRALESEVPAELFHVKYPRSLWATTGVNISTLSQDALSLLLLVRAFEGPSVPEEVIRVLFTSMKLEKSSAFSLSTIELERRHLIKISSFPLVALGLQRNWQVHSLRKRYIEEEMKGAKAKMFASLAAAKYTISEGKIVRGQDAFGSPDRRLDNVPNSEQPGDAVVTTLCALYLDKHVAGKAAVKMGLPLEQFSKQKRDAIEPVTRLLALPVTSNQTTATARDCATKVTIRYILRSI
ncbi:unnamed protein product [Calypogeia fissa]